MFRNIIDAYKKELAIMEQYIAQTQSEPAKAIVADMESAFTKIDELANLKEVSKNDTLNLIRQLFVNALFEMRRNKLNNEPIYKALEEFLKVDTSLYFFQYIKEPIATPQVYRTNFSVLNEFKKEKLLDEAAVDYTPNKFIELKKRRDDIVAHESKTKKSNPENLKELTEIDKKIFNWMFQEYKLVTEQAVLDQSKLKDETPKPKSYRG